jgi:hypothetical protein
MAISHLDGIAVANISHLNGIVKANVSAVNGVTASFGGSYTPLGGFTDDFSDGSISASWTTSGATVSETGGVLQISGSALAHLRSAVTYDMTGKTVRVQFVNPPANNANNGQQLLVATSDAFTNYYMVQQVNGTLQFIRNGSSLFSVAYNSSTHLWMQIRHSAGTTYFDTSSDGVTFTNRHSTATTLTITAMYIYMRKYHGGGGASTYQWDNFDSNL